MKAYLEIDLPKLCYECDLFVGANKIGENYCAKLKMMPSRYCNK